MSCVDFVAHEAGFCEPQMPLWFINEPQHSLFCVALIPVANLEEHLSGCCTYAEDMLAKLTQVASGRDYFHLHLRFAILCSP